MAEVNLEVEAPTADLPASPKDGHGGLLGRTLPALRHRDFRLYFGGQLVSLTGTWTQQVAQGWLVWTLSHSAFMLGVVAGLQSLPVLVLGVGGGVVADRLPRRLVLIGTQVASLAIAAALAILTATGLVAPGHEYSLAVVGVLALALGVVNAIDAPTRQAFVVELVARNHLLNAISLNAGAFNGARIFGPAVAGVLISLVGVPICFALNAVSFLPVIASLWLIRPPATARKASERRGSVLAEARAAVAFAWRHPLIRDLYLTVLGLSVVLAFASLLPIFADDVLHSGAGGYSLLSLAGGAGSVLGAAALALTGERRGRHGPWIVYGTIAYCVLTLAFALSRSMALSFALLTVVGFAGMVSMARANTALQLAVPDEIRGGVMSIYVLLLMGLAPVAAVQLGLVAQLTGAPTAVAVESGLCALFVAGLHYLRREVRERA